MSDKVAEAATLKAKGNALFRDSKFLEAIVEYTAAIDLDPRNPVIYSNRSLAFLRLEQYFYALKDADTSIHLNPEWSKGYYRKGQVETLTEQFEAALVTYKKGIEVNSFDEGLKTALKEAELKYASYKVWKIALVRRYVVFFAVFGIMLVAADNLFETKYLDHPLLQFGVVTGSIFLGMLTVFGIIGFHDSRKRCMLEPPADLLKELQSDSVTTASSEAGLSDDMSSQEGPVMSKAKKEN